VKAFREIVNEEKKEEGTKDRALGNAADYRGHL